MICQNCSAKIHKVVWGNSGFSKISLTETLQKTSSQTFLLKNPSEPRETNEPVTIVNLEKPVTLVNVKLVSLVKL